MPFNTDLGPRFGKGQDNTVYRMVHGAEKPHLRVPAGFVLKVNHENAGDHRIRYADERRAAEAGVRYKKNKYDILKAFLGDFIPETYFVLGEVKSQEPRKGDVFRPAEYTIQREIPKFSISDLTDEQKQSPALRSNVYGLLTSLQRMYRILGETNARTAQGIALDGKLDLGGVSDYILSEDLDDGLNHKFTEEDVDLIIATNKSPNLLVDPESMQLYCIDFDQGQWYPGMDEAKEKALVALEKDIARERGALATSQTFGQQRLPI